MKLTHKNKKIQVNKALLGYGTCLLLPVNGILVKTSWFKSFRYHPGGENNFLSEGIDLGAQSYNWELNIKTPRTVSPPRVNHSNGI